MQSELIFPTIITWDFKTELLESLNELYSKIDWNVYKDDRYVNGYTTYFNRDKTNDDLIYEYSQPLVDAIIQHCYERAEMEKIDIGKKKFYVDNLWLSRMLKYGHHIRHLHHGSHYSGTFYVHSDDDSANIIFYDPRLFKQFVGDLDEHDVIVYKPDPGKLIMWSSYIEHEVTTSLSERRDAISFNVGLR